MVQDPGGLEQMERRGSNGTWNWWPEVYRLACQYQGLEPDPRLLGYSTTYESARADLKQVAG